MKESNLIHTMTPEEKADWMANPAAYIYGSKGLPAGVPSRKNRVASRHEREIEARSCNLAGCIEEATESGRCVRHEAAWQRLNRRAES